MKLVVDANILFSALIKEGITAELISKPSLELFTPDFILKEIIKHSEIISSKTQRTRGEIDKVLDDLLSVITIVKVREVEDRVNDAKEISPDQNDFMYFALALKLNCPLWSNDKLLKNQDRVKVYSTSDLIKIF